MEWDNITLIVTGTFVAFLAGWLLLRACLKKDEEE
jgi:hypothetical protein